MKPKNNTRHTRLISWVASLMLAASWVVALLLCFRSGTAGKVVGCIFLGGKAWMLLLTMVGWLRCPAMARRLFLGRYQFDEERPLHGLCQAMLRFTWELPQLLLGYSVAMIRVIMYRIDRVEVLRGNTYAIDEGRNDFRNMGMSLGCVINIWISGTMGSDFEYETRYSQGQILMHEYGHTFDSLWCGPLYLLIVGIPSYLSVQAEMIGLRGHKHKDLYAERWANLHAQHYFGISIRDLSD